MKKYLLPAASVALCLGLVFAIGGAASAHGKGSGGKGHNPGAVATGTTSCNIHGRLTISSSGTVTIWGNLTPNKHGRACTPTGGTKLRTGHISTALTSAPITTPTSTTTTSTTTTSTTSTTTTSTTTTTLAGTTTTTMVCLPLPVGPVADVSGGVISWSPRPKVAASVGVALTGGTISEVTVGSKQYLEIAYMGGSVASGSFAGSTGVSLTARSNGTVSSCAHSHTITFHGTLDL